MSKLTQGQLPAAGPQTSKHVPLNYQQPTQPPSRLQALKKLPFEVQCINFIVCKLNLDKGGK